MSFLHDLFFRNTRFDVTDESLAELYPFAEYNRAIKPNTPTPINTPIEIPEPIVPNTLEKCKIDNSIFETKPVLSSKQVQPTQLSIEHPTLFWCVFVAHYGYSEYLRVGKRYQNREIAEKQQMMEILSKNPKQMKDGSMKITNDAVQEILSGLMISSGESFSALVAYARYYNKTIYVVFACSFLVFSPTKDPTGAKVEDICVLYQTRKHPKYGGSYRLEYDVTLEKLEQIRVSKIEMEHYAKPFRGISVYKRIELEAMASKIGILDASTFGKAPLYAKIVEKCCEGIQTL